MTIQDAIRLMAQTTKISMESDAALVGDITLRQAALAAAANPRQGVRQKLPLIQAVGVQGDLALRPISAMLELARGTALNDDPEVAAFARRWSTLRYLGVFANHGRNTKLRLNRGALQFIGPNQRRVLSEDLGIGFGIMVAKHWCRTRDPRVGPITVIDVDKALHRGTVPNLLLAGSRQPDYLLSYPDPTNSSLTTYELLETKGTVNATTARGQLARAATQLAGLTVSGSAMTGLAVATVSNVNGLGVLAVDPEEAF